MTDALRHRGPDDEGYLLLNPHDGTFETRAGGDTHPDLHLPSINHLPWPRRTRLVFAHRRLSILDLSATGHQPMSDPQKTMWITYNGEVYNYKEIRQELENLGVRFFSGTDTEVVLEAYKMWGKDCLHKLNGMWAFALWDVRQKILFCARDRFGVKPFYYAQAGLDFFFASEIKPLLLLPQVPRKVSEEAIFDYLVLSLPTREPQTFFKGIQSLEPGHCLTVDLNGDLKYERWYFFPEVIGNKPYQKECASEFRERLSEAVRLRLRSDVRVGSCLSGGLDSSSIVSLAANYNSEPLETFSACFDEERYDERKFIQPVLEKTGAHPHFVFPQGNRFWEEWPELMTAQEEPFGSTSLYAHWCVMREASSRSVHVLLNGQGGDELLAGYPRYQTNRALGQILRGDIRGFPLLFKDPRTLGFLMFRLSPSFFHLPFIHQIARATPFLRRDFRGKYFTRHVKYFRDRISCQRNLSESLRSDFLTYILPALLRYEDKNSMHFSVEARLPFMDYRLVEWVFGLEEAAKVEEGVTKRILRESMKGILPEKVRLRSDKMGFATPEEKWLAMGRSAILHFFSKPSKAAVAPWIRVEELKSFLERRHAWNGLLWRVVNLEMWLRTFFTEIEQHAPEYSDAGVVQ
ncbi:MAG: asparagine synthase (glutamine-hydrolyzing) [Candidatus Omnitrophica bacterium]|nr:asparagine synthase (glutamine-hydrolyzing) [Candidatus Omnitrophota bacterium]